MTPFVHDPSFVRSRHDDLLRNAERYRRTPRRRVRWFRRRSTSRQIS